MRVNIRQVIAGGGAPIPPGGAPPVVGAPGVPVVPEPEPAKFGVKEAVETIRELREGMGSSRELIREGRGLWKDLQEMFPQIRPENRVGSTDVKEKAVDPVRRSGPDWEAAMRDPQGGGRSAPARVEVPKDAPALPPPVPPKSEAEAALREETRVLIGRVKHEDLKDLTILGLFTLAEGYELTKTADFVDKHEAKLREVMDELGEARLRTAAGVIVDQVDATTLPVVKHFIQKAAGDAPAETKPTDPPTAQADPSPAPRGDAASSAPGADDEEGEPAPRKRAAKKAAKRGAPVKAAKKKGGRRK